MNNDRDDREATPAGVRVVAVLGSVTPPGRLRRALAEAVDRSGRRDGVSARMIDRAGLAMAAADDTAAVVDALAGPDAVVLATPVCRGSRTGVLKNLLDHVPVTVLEGTPAGITAMRATQHHDLGAERHLRDVLAFFGALVAPVAVYLTGAEFDDGRPIGAADRDLNALLAKMVGLARAVGCRSHDGPQPLAAGGARR